ncbi:MAG: response regulator, partial [Magnetococcales bacterium]|nr:response regulator [Magnetococcales bacterium]
MNESSHKSVVMVVDDSLESLDLMVELLSGLYRVTPVKNGQLALQRALKEPLPELILLDIMMPDLDGYEVCRRLKADPGTQDIPVIFVTSKINQEDEVRGLALGAVDFIKKPINPPIVLARIQTHLTIRRLHNQLVQSQKAEAIASLAGGIAHDINNVLGIIIGNAELGKMGAIPPEVAGASILEAAARARDLVRNLLSFSNKWPGSRAVPRAEPATTLETVVTPPGPAGEMGRVLLVDDEAPLVEVWHRMLEGLGYTVCGFTDPVAALTRFRETPDFFDVVITDQTMPKMVGTALGEAIHAIRPEIPLFLCTGFSESMTPESAREIGLAGIFLKPVALSEMAVALRGVQGCRKRSAPDAPSRVGEPLPSGPILLVDDEPEMVRLLERNLLEQSCTVLTALSGRDALQILRTQSIDLLITDLGLPDMDGLEMMVQATTLKADLQTIIITGRGNMECAIAAMNLGAFAYLTKPINLNEFNIHVKRCLEKIGLNKALREARDRAMASSMAKSNFLATMSHEIRTPMNAILGMTELALQCEMSPKLQDHLSKVFQASRTLMRILNDILDFSKIEADRLELEQNSFLLRHIFDRLANLYGGEAARKEVELVFGRSGESLFALVGDALRLEQILSNLIGNAIKFTRRGEIVVTVRSETPETETGEVMLEFQVRDTGVGMSAESIERLFEPFVQADGTITRRYGGSGLGLAICKRLVGLMGGRIWVESVPEVGTRFRFTAGFKRPMVDRIEGALRPPESMLQLKSLVVDDRAAARDSLESLLRLFSFHTTGVGSGTEAVAAWRASIAES